MKYYLVLYNDNGRQTQAAIVRADNIQQAMDRAGHMRTFHITEIPELDYKDHYYFIGYME